MQQDARKAAVDAYKEQKTLAGIYAVRCSAMGACWVGRAPNVMTIQNQLWFALKLGSSPFRALQAAWTAQGPAGLHFEVLEKIAAEELQPFRDQALKARQQVWCERLGAVAL